MSVVFACVLACACVTAWAEDRGHLVRYAVEDSFGWVKEAVRNAITERGMVISSEMHVGDMLERTGADVGSNRQIYLEAESIEFCSAVLSRRMMEADPANLVFCPFIVAIYVLPEEPELTYVSYRKPMTADAPEPVVTVLKEVEALLDEVARAATE